jgi:hypothetical protein
MFPQGLFYILSRKHGFAIDVYDGQTKVCSFPIILMRFFAQELTWESHLL